MGHGNVLSDYRGLLVTWSHMTWGFTSLDPRNNYGVYYNGEHATIAGDMGWEVYRHDGLVQEANGNIAFTPGVPEVWRGYQNMTYDLLTEFAEGIQLNSGIHIVILVPEPIAHLI